MGKNKGKGKKYESRRKLEEMRKHSKKLEKLVAIGCNHQKPNGDLDIIFLDRDKDIVECRVCGETFDMGTLKQGELRNSFLVLNSAIQQIRALSSEDDQDAVERLGRIAYALEQVPEQYKRTMEAFSKGGKKKKKKNKNRGANVEWQSGLNTLFKAKGNKKK